MVENQLKTTNNSSPKIAIIIPYFGKWPEWIDLFFYSCIQNTEIDWFFFTDCNISLNIKNLIFKQMTFDEYCSFVSAELDIKFHPVSPYKLCDLKVFYGFIHRELLVNYDFWGFGDVDVIWGDIRGFYKDDLLEKFDVFSTHADRLSGHLAILRNNQNLRETCFKIENWKDQLEHEENFGLDEVDFSTLIYPLSKYIRKFYGRIIVPFLGWRNGWVLYYSLMPFINTIFRIKSKRLFFKEQHTTPILSDDGLSSEHDASNWYYKDGKITNDKTNMRYIYLHFMVYKKNRFRTYYYWKDKFYFLPESFEFSKGVLISKNGITCN